MKKGLPIIDLLLLGEYDGKATDYELPFTKLENYIKVDSSTSAEKCRDIEQELKRELIHAVIDNGYLTESTEIVSKLNVKMEIKKAPEMGVNF